MSAQCRYLHHGVCQVGTGRKDSGDRTGAGQFSTAARSNLPDEVDKGRGNLAGQAILSTTLALTGPAGGAAGAACRVAAPDGAEEAPVEGEDVGLAVAAA